MNDIQSFASLLNAIFLPPAALPQNLRKTFTLTWPLHENRSGLMVNRSPGVSFVCRRCVVVRINVRITCGEINWFAIGSTKSTLLKFTRLGLGSKFT